MEATTGSQPTNRIHACAYAQYSTVQPPAEISYRVRLRRLSLFINSRVMHACSCPRPLFAGCRIDAWHAMAWIKRRGGAAHRPGVAAACASPTARPATRVPCGVCSARIRLGSWHWDCPCRCGPFFRSLPASRGARRGRTLFLTDRLSSPVPALHLRRPGHAKSAYPNYPDLRYSILISDRIFAYLKLL